ncbi:Separase [Caenorhabditis elegans]|uniref:Separase n=1 Tax=Caenorhabditis elegans TaxID=6239 RepID=A0A2K5ATJ5_CAEEL|nr:Separase [Caenorhabditis elegans]SPC47110.1 Separase [Caenorhabditis elegans]|eukprot:NP_001348658.1 Uncharacterized protein CELE_C13E3.1 [Caenorhabditis elegans]
MEWFGWLKRVKPVGKKFLRICANPENELVELVKKGRSASYTKCELDCTSLLKVLHIFTALMAAGKRNAAAELCRTIADKCFNQNAENPYRLLFLSFAMMAECEEKFYDMNISPQNKEDISLKLRYSLCQQAFSGIMEMEPTIFKISELLTLSEEFAHFSCFRQCHVNLLKNLSEIDEDENVDWFDRVKVLDSNILSLINESDIAARLCETDKEKKEFQQNLLRLPPSSLEQNDQYCFSWFNQLHLREIYVRSTAAIEVLKSDEAFKTFSSSASYLPRSLLKRKQAPKMHRRRLQARNPEMEAEEKAKRISFGEDSGVLADANMLIMRKGSKSIVCRRRSNIQINFGTEVDDLNYNSPIFEGEKSFTDKNAENVKERSFQRKEREKNYNTGGAIDCRKRMPDGVRKKIRIILRNMMADGREIQKQDVLEDEILNKAFPVTDDEFSDDETAPKPFFRTETLETIQKKKMRKLGWIDSNIESKHVLWWNNAKDELLTARAIANHCVKITGDSSEPFATFEEYLGKFENGGKLRDRMSESRRETNSRVFDVKKESGADDGMLLTMPSSDSFKEYKINNRRSYESVGLNSLLLQNMRRRCIDELLMLIMIMKGQQQLQDGNVVRCLAYLMLIEYKLAVFAETTGLEISNNRSFYEYLKNLYKHLLAKFRLYSTDVFGVSCLKNTEEMILNDDHDKFDLNTQCFKFCQETNAYFFCICIRGKFIQLRSEELMHNVSKLDREEIEQQHEIFFGLDKTNKNNHLSSFWRTECMPIVLDQENLEPIYKATTDFVCGKYNIWKEMCKADSENFRKTNTDNGYLQESNLTFVGEAIEKDVYMVAVYRGEKIAEDRDRIGSQMHLLCRKIRSQAGFVSVKRRNCSKDLTVQ